ncbi:MAG: NAD(P)-binding domain-containing protein [Chloroflexota bacterium]
MQIEFGVRLEDVKKEDGLFVARTSTGVVRARRVLLATGWRGTPRRLGVLGDDSAHVRPRLDDPALYAGAPCVVVGGGDAAVEAALALAARHPGHPLPPARPSTGYPSREPLPASTTPRCVVPWWSCGPLS